jgi:hypothetical protein
MSHRREEESEESEPLASEPGGRSALDELLEHAPPVSPPVATRETGSLVGEVVDARHPTLRGRVRVRWQDLEGHTFEKWLATLQSLPVRVADRVLMIRAANWPEPVVTGVIDGFARRPEAERGTAAHLELSRDEAVRVRSASGEDLVEVFEDEHGPVIRLLRDDVDLDLQGKLRVRAKSIELQATEGEARVRASGDVLLEGETIRLN